MARLRISLVTPSFNQAPFIERTVQSILNQQGDFDLEYMVFDGGSTDGTLDVLRRHDGRLFWASERDRGQSDAINKGLRRATGDVVGWVNSDDVLRPGALAKVAEVFRAPSALWMHGRCDLIDEHDRVIRHGVTAYKEWCCRHYSYARLVTENYISQQTTFWRRSLHDRVGYLDEGLHFAMDWDLWLRFGRVADPVYVPERLSGFRWYKTNKSAADFKARVEEGLEMARRHAPGRRWLYLVNRLKTARTIAAYRVYTLFGL